MSYYLITYLGTPAQMSPEEGQEHMKQYQTWLANLGEAAVSPMNPIKNTRTISSDGAVTNGGSTTMSGFTIIEAESDDAAMDITKSCPFLEVGGSLELSELIKMTG